MRALSAAQRRFAMAAVMFPLAKDWQIAKAAGFSDRSHGYLRKTACLLFQDEKVLAGIRECADKTVRSTAMLGVATMAKIARLDGHKDQFKAARELAGLNGFSVTQKIDVNSTVTTRMDVTTASAKIAEFRQKFPEQFAKLLGAPLPVLEGEFSEVKDG